MPEINELMNAVAFVLDTCQPPTDEALRQMVQAQAIVIGMKLGQSYSNEEIDAAVRQLETRFSIRMEAGVIFEAEDYRPWLASRQGDIKWYYWRRYKMHLLTARSFPPQVVRTLDEITDKILDHIEDPTKEGSWNRRGLVVGHVQSGKTANYTGLITKAADAGYKVIIVLAGLLNTLRNQTQERIDSDFMGWCTRKMEATGCSRFSDSRTPRRPVCLTTAVEDFNRNSASAQLPLNALTEPIVLVLKKNIHSLEKLHTWLSEQNRHDLKDYPMLMIDDEADHASVNTNSGDNDPTRINLAIRKLLALFSRNSFVGYTATPFANIFIDPENEHEMQTGEVYADLFPRDFILSLDPPDNYIGPHRIFADDRDIDCIRPIDDNEDQLPCRHKISFRPPGLPKSLEKAIECFLVARAVRLLRGQLGKHHSMMINASRFTGVQELLKGLVLERVKELREAIQNYAELRPADALKNPLIASVHRTWESEYKSSEFSWDAVQKHLKDSVGPVEIVCVNSSSRDTLDYSRREYPNGRCLIAIGGLGLSRGLTLEGLMVSYFLRNSVMYDTLMQMGRWFGYRDGYAEICRIFMTKEAEAWYSHIAEATEELREDFKSMERAKLRPIDFGLRVRSHPTALIVTARNKMRSAREVPVSIALAGRLAETSVLLGSARDLDENTRTLTRAVEDAAANGKKVPSPLGELWEDVPAAVICSAIRSFRNHPECMLTYPEPLIEYIEWLAANNQGTFNVLLRTGGTHTKEFNVAGYSYRPAVRIVAGRDESRIEFKKRRVASKGDERAGLTKEQIALVKSNFGGDNVPDKEYRKVKGRPPLFIVNFVAVKLSHEEDESATIIAPTFGVSFPGDSGCVQANDKLVKYNVNTVWWRNNYFGNEEADEEDE
jgi:hypothetical protein